VLLKASRFRATNRTCPLLRPRPEAVQPTAWSAATSGGVCADVCRVLNLTYEARPASACSASAAAGVSLRDGAAELGGLREWTPLSLGPGDASGSIDVPLLASRSFSESSRELR